MGVEKAAPRVVAGAAGLGRALGVDLHADPEAIPEAPRVRAPIFEQRIVGHVVCRHERHGDRREVLAAIEAAAIGEHLSEPQVVAGCRHEARAARGPSRGIGWRLEQLEIAALEVPRRIVLVHRREQPGVRVRDHEAGRAQAQWIEQPLL